MLRISRPAFGCAARSDGTSWKATGGASSIGIRWGAWWRCATGWWWVPSPRCGLRDGLAGSRWCWRQFVLGFTILAAVIFVLASAQLNRLTLYLSPLVLVVLLGYSYMKRITRWSHLVLGLALGLAPSAAWIAVRGSLDSRILVLTAAVTLWAGGFDVLYACQDCEHDRAAGLNSLPQAVGIPAAFWAARAMHLAMLGLLAWFGILFQFRVPGWLGIAAAALLLDRKSTRLNSSH